MMMAGAARKHTFRLLDRNEQLCITSEIQCKTGHTRQRARATED